MLVRPLPRIDEEWTCARCGREPGHVDDSEAFAVGYTSSRRELHGSAPFTVCAGCVRVEAHGVHRDRVVYWTGLGSSEADVRAMLRRPA